MEEPSFGETQIWVAIAFLAIALTLASVFALVALQSRREIPLERVKEVAYRIRPVWLALLVILLSGTVFVSMFFLPYSRGADVGAEIRVVGGQFYWSMSPPEVPAGTKVDFAVTSADVNHGFGIYDPDGELLGSVQAMPGYTNHLDLRLDKPGSYLIACLEFCGLGHHEMAGRFEVTP
jgi:cytochrome c oxidase subunit 2